MNPDSTQIAKFMGPSWGPPGSCRPQMGPMLTPWIMLSGYIPPNIHMHLPDDVPKTRLNSDLKVFDFDHKLLTLCQISGLRIVNGRSLGDTLGIKTCHKWNGSSTVTTKISLFSQSLSYWVIDILNEWPDHCPIALNLNISISRNKSEHAQCNTMCPRKLKWSAARERTFIKHLSRAPAQTRLAELALNIHERPSDIEDHVNNIYDVICEAASVSTSYKYSMKKGQTHSIR